MALVIFCIGSIVLGALLHIYFPRFSWTYLLVSIIVSVVGLLATRWALGEIGPPFPRMLELIEELVAWNLGPWLIFAFLPLQAGYLAAMLLRWRFCNSTRPVDGSH